ncbi:hypothetical protein RUESEDTHA_01453 [Ruegeria sp. THAF57]|nr:hypothetical protein RUESEDTHA_01453 [Ruegeria sp. THAF57]
MSIRVDLLILCRILTKWRNCVHNLSNFVLFQFIFG